MNAKDLINATVAGKDPRKLVEQATAPRVSFHSFGGTKGEQEFETPDFQIGSRIRLTSGGMLTTPMGTEVEIKAEETGTVNDTFEDGLVVDLDGGETVIVPFNKAELIEAKKREQFAAGDTKTLTAMAADEINKSAGAMVVQPGDQVTIVDPTPDEGGFVLVRLPDGTEIGALPGDFESKKHEALDLKGGERVDTPDGPGAVQDVFMQDDVEMVEVILDEPTAAGEDRGVYSTSEVSRLESKKHEQFRGLVPFLRGKDVPEHEIDVIVSLARDGNLDAAADKIHELPELSTDEAQEAEEELINEYESRRHEQDDDDEDEEEMERRRHEQTAISTELPTVGDVVEVKGRVPDNPAASIGEVLSPGENGVNVEWDGGGVSFVPGADLQQTGEGSWVYVVPATVSHKKRAAARIERFRREAQIKVNAEAIGEQPGQLGAEMHDFLEAEGIENKFETDGGFVLLDLEEDADAEQALALIQQFFQAPAEQTEVHKDKDDDDEEMEAGRYGNPEDDEEEEDEGRGKMKMKKRREQDDEEEKEEEEEEEGRKHEANVRFDLATVGSGEELETIIEELQDAGGTLVTRNPLIFSTDDPDGLMAAAADFGLEGQVESKKHEDVGGLVVGDRVLFNGRPAEVVKINFDDEPPTVDLEDNDGFVFTRISTDRIEDLPDPFGGESHKRENESPREHALDLLKGGVDKTDVLGALVDEFGISDDEAADIVTDAIESLAGESKKHEQPDVAFIGVSDMSDAMTVLDEANLENSGTTTPDGDPAVMVNREDAEEAFALLDAEGLSPKRVESKREQDDDEDEDEEMEGHDLPPSVVDQLKQLLRQQATPEVVAEFLLTTAGLETEAISNILRTLAKKGAFDSFLGEQDAETGEKLDKPEVGDPVMMPDDENKVGVVTDMFDDGTIAVAWDQGEETIMQPGQVRLQGVEKVPGDDFSSGVAEQAGPRILSAVNLAIKPFGASDKDVQDIAELLTDVGEKLDRQAIQDAIDQVIGGGFSGEDKMFAVVQIGDTLGIDVSGVSI